MKGIAVLILVILLISYLFGVLGYLGCGLCPLGKAKVRLRLMGCLSGDYSEARGEGFTALGVPCGESEVVSEYLEERVPYSGVVVLRGEEIVFSRRLAGDVSQGIQFALAGEPEKMGCGEEINESLFNMSGKVDCAVSFPYGKE